MSFKIVSLMLGATLLAGIVRSEVSNPRAEAPREQETMASPVADAADSAAEGESMSSDALAAGSPIADDPPQTTKCCCIGQDCLNEFLTCPQGSTQTPCPCTPTSCMPGVEE